MASPTYTHKTPPVSGAGEGEQDNLGGQVMDANRVAIQGLGSGVVTQDATASAVKSPQTATGTATTLTIPQNAIRVIFSNTDATNNLYISEASALGSYYILPKGVTQTFDVGRQGFIYVQSSSTSTAYSFAFQLVD